MFPHSRSSTLTLSHPVTISRTSGSAEPNLTQTPTRLTKEDPNKKAYGFARCVWLARSYPDLDIEDCQFLYLFRALDGQCFLQVRWRNSDEAQYLKDQSQKKKDEAVKMTGSKNARDVLMSDCGRSAAKNVLREEARGMRCYAMV
jgi:hypothetical protein